MCISSGAGGTSGERLEGKMQRTWYWIIAAIVVVLAIYFFMGRGTETPPAPTAPAATEPAAPATPPAN